MTDQPVVKIMRLHPDRDSDVELPRYMTSQAAGMDISAAVEQPLVIPSGGIVLVPTGFAIALPRGYEAQIRPRSGLAVKHGITVVNSPGTIDADYRGEVKVGLVNLATASYTIQRGERIAQMIIQPVSHAQMQEVAVLEETRRSSGGFGSTGA